MTRGLEEGASASLGPPGAVERAADEIARTLERSPKQRELMGFGIL